MSYEARAETIEEDSRLLRRQLLRIIQEHGWTPLDIAAHSDGAHIYPGNVFGERYGPSQYGPTEVTVRRWINEGGHPQHWEIAIARAVDRLLKEDT